MTLEDFGDLISTLDIPAVYGYYKSETAPAYITYIVTDKNVIHADGIVIYSEEWIELKLVTKMRDLDAESSIEELLTENQISFYDPDFEFNEKEGIHTATYYFQL
ncbi:MAG: hypothetical protein J6S92_06840 [Oscillospiraceae bacterium]|nr:hypothetical protein [Bacteroidaceae bacterium]MBP0975624.1 hypothetical protein [Oscillospiraceae bacterium]MBP0987979.1 hypothetical protein [Oscillospiraceae bacterium]